MPLGDPKFAPRRADLQFLRRRVKPRTPDTPAPPAPAGHVDYTHPDRGATTSRQPTTPPTSARPTIDFSRPDRHSTAPTGPAQPATPTRPKIDFSRPGRAAPATPAPEAASAPTSGSLDLSDPGPAASAAPRRPTPAALAQRTDRRIEAGEQVLLGVATPTATLTRVQSGVGHLTIEAVCSSEVGDLRLGALYRFASGGTSTVQHAGGNRFAPSSRRPVIIASREEYERLAFDLRQIRDLERVTVYAFSESRTALQWGGTLVLETFGRGRVEIPLETLYASSLAVLLSLSNVDGELVVRAELESIAGDVREAARAYGYDRITWRDDRTPVD